MKTKMPATVDAVRDQWLCCGCGMCEAVCPCEAVQMRYDDKHRSHVPLIDKEKCVSCSLCVQICPGTALSFSSMARVYLNGQRHDLMAGHWIRNQLAWATDTDIRFRASSGGVATALGLYLLKSDRVDKVLTVAASDNDPLDFRGMLIDNPKKLYASLGSKYCSVPLCTALKNVNKGDRIAVFGLPCHIQAIRKAQSYSRFFGDIEMILIGLFCGGAKGRDATKCMLKKNDLELGQIVSINYRGNGWPGCLCAELKDGTSVTLPYPDYADLVFHAFRTWRCTMCSDGLAELADISLGDAWLKEIKSTNNQGVSMVITRSRKGEELVQAAQSAGSLECSAADDRDGIRSQYRMLLRKKHGIAASKLMARLLGRGIPKYDNTATRPESSAIADRLKQELLWMIARWSTENPFIDKLVSRF